MIKEMEAVWEELDKVLDSIEDDDHYVQTLEEMIGELTMRLEGAREEK